jgi:hypothetical protein
MKRKKPRPTGRPKLPPGEGLTSQLPTIRLLDAEKAAVEAAADDAGLRVAQWVRAVLRKELFRLNGLESNLDI